MKAYQKTVIYTLDDISEIEEETKKQFKDGWRVSKQGEVKNSYLFPPKKEVEIIYIAIKTN